MSDAGLGILAGLARSDELAGTGSVSGQLFLGVMLSLAFEAEVVALGLPVEGHGFETRPVGIPR